MKTQPITTFGNRLHEIMQIRNKRQIDIHNDCGISKPLISQWLSGKTRALNTEHLYILGKYFHVSETWLMGYDVPMERTDNAALGEMAKAAYVNHQLTTKEKIVIKLDTLSEDDLKKVLGMLDVMFPQM